MIGWTLYVIAVGAILTVAYRQAARLDAAQKQLEAMRERWKQKAP